MANLRAQFGTKADGLQKILHSDMETAMRAKFASTLGMNLTNRIQAGNLTTSVSEDDFADGQDGWNSAANTTVSTSKATYSVDTSVTGEVVAFDLLNAWNTVKNAYFTSDTAEQLRLDGFVHADVMVGLNSTGKSYIEVIGAKRGNFLTGGGADTIWVQLLTNGDVWSNEFRVGSGAGNDSIAFSGLSAAELASDPTYMNMALDNSGEDTRIFADLGAGNDQFVSSSLARDKVWGGAGNDRIVTGGGDDWIDGGAGDDHLIGGRGADRFVFTGSFGNDLISEANFKGDRDTLQFDKSVFANVGEVLAAARYDADTSTTYIDVDFDKNGTVDASVAIAKFNIANLGTAFDFAFI